MSVTPILYIILGLSIGVGITLIYLQEKFVRERQKILALAASEKAKSQQMLKELDAKWEREILDAKKELSGARQKRADLEGAVKISEEKIAQLNETIAAQNERASEVEDVDQTEIDDLRFSLQEKQGEFTALCKEKDELLGSLKEARLEISELHAELDIVKSKITSLESEKTKAESGDDFLVMTPGKHYIPGAVARALMGKKSDG